MQTPIDRRGSSRSTSRAIVWLKNERHNWFNYVEGEDLQVISPSLSTLDGASDGAHSVEWWDTHGGKVTSVREAVAREGRLTVSVDGFTRDLACRIRRARRDRPGQAAVRQSEAASCRVSSPQAGSTDWAVWRRLRAKGCAAHRTFRTYSSRRARRRILPTADFGRPSLNSTARGTL